VVRIIRLTAVFLAAITPKRPRKGWCEPPIAAISAPEAMIERGVAHTRKPTVSTIIIGTWNLV